MIAAAKGAGAGLRKHFGKLSELTVRSKTGPSDMVSAADEEAEQLIKSMLADARPSYGFLGEEGGEAIGSDSSRTWIVDPLDGTTNFLFGVPLWAVNVALAVDGKVVSGVTYVPMLDELFIAELGKGAWLNGQPIRVSERASLADAVLSCGIPFSAKPHQAVFPLEMALLTPHVAGIRRTGAGAIDSAWVACGRWDSYWERQTSAWDMAPGVILVEEAGGRVTDVTGGAFDIHRENVCMTNGAIHEALIDRLNQALSGVAA